jgi:uncharacterized protein
VRILIWALIVYFVVSWILQNRKTPNRRSDPERSDIQIESIVQCAHCGLHVPASEAVITPTGAIYCCEDHRGKVKQAEF